MRKNSERSCRSNTAQHRTTRTRNTTIKLMPPGAIRSRCGNHVIISTLSRSGLNATKLGANKSGDRLLCWRPHPHATTEVAGDPPVMAGGRCRVRGGSVATRAAPLWGDAKSARRSGIASGMAACGGADDQNRRTYQRCCAHGREPLAENPGRMTDRGLLCWAVLGERGGPPSRMVQEYDQIVRCSARDLSQCSAGLRAIGCAHDSQPC